MATSATIGAAANAPGQANAIRRFESRLRAAYRAIVARPLATYVIVAMLPVALRLAMLHWFPVPQPAVHDEFSYLLGADTFASGRLTNPTHPLWKHFESFHILQQPTYMSKYPPMQALALALGEVLGHAWIGVLLSVAVMGWCFAWALRAWLPPSVAFAGALLAAARIGPYWANSYWGGAVAAIGGALLVGALGRLLQNPRRSAAFLFSVGLVILANSRPWEGGVVALATTAVLAWVTLRRRMFRSLLRVAVLPAAATLIPAALAMGYYNYRVTGNWLELPYQVHERQYAVYSNFLWSQPRKPPAYNNAVLERYWTTYNQAAFEFVKRNWPWQSIERIGNGLALLLASPWIALVLVLLPFPRSSLTNRLTYAILIAFLLALLPLEDLEQHYLGTIAAVVFIRFMDSLAALWKWRPAARPIGPVLALFAFEYVLLQSWLLLFPAYPPMQEFAMKRANLEHHLEAKPGKQLVIVRYASDHFLHEEWVYNRADIDASRVVWARDLGPGRNDDLLHYFSSRRVWLLEPDRPGATLQPYAVRPQ